MHNTWVSAGRSNLVQWCYKLSWGFLTTQNCPVNTESLQQLEAGRASSCPSTTCSPVLCCNKESLRWVLPQIQIFAGKQAQIEEYSPILFDGICSPDSVIFPSSPLHEKEEGGGGGGGRRHTGKQQFLKAKATNLVLWGGRNPLLNVSPGPSEFKIQDATFKGDGLLNLPHFNTSFYKGKNAG